MKTIDPWRSMIAATAALVIAALAVFASKALPADAPEATDAGGPARAAIRLNARQRQAMGLTYGVAERRSIDKTIRTVGRFDYDERRLAAVTLKVGGYVEKLYVDYTGKAVRKGEPLFTIYSPELVSAEQEYLLAVQNQKVLAKSTVPSAAAAATSLANASRQRLLLWDLSERQIRELEESGKPSFQRTIRSPTSGVVLEKMVVAGQSIAAGMTLYKIADLSTIWVYADIYEYELPFVKVGQSAEIRLSYAPDRVFQAKVAYLYPTLDPKTRTVKVRFELPNSADPLLRPEMYGEVTLRVPLGERLVVPKTAVLDSGRRQIVFVGTGEGRLEPRDVEVGVRVDDFVEIKKGLSVNERIVTSANFLVDSESQLQGAESMMSMMGAIGMGDWKMESAKPMSMGGGGVEMAGGEKVPTSPPRHEGAGGQEKQVGDLRVTVYPAADAAKVGGSAIRVRVYDANGTPVARAKVSFDYTMDMPGMAIENAEAKELGDGVYEGMAKFSMGGPWSVVVQIDRPGKPSLRENFTLRVAG